MWMFSIMAAVNNKPALQIINGEPVYAGAHREFSGDRDRPPGSFYMRSYPVFIYTEVERNP